MAIDVQTVAPSGQARALAVPESADFDQRWDAWQRKGAAHDRAVRRQLAVGAPVVIAAVAVVAYFLLQR